MAVAFVKQLGNSSIKTAGTNNLSHTFTGTVAAGNTIIARVLYDNSATASKPLVSSIGKQAGETNNWVLLGQINSTSTTAGAFASGSMWAIQTTVNWAAAAYTVTLDTTTVMKAVSFVEFSGVTATLRSTSGATYSTATTAASATTTGTTPQVGDLALGFIFGSNVAAAMAGDTDTTGGSWSTPVGVGSTGSSAATNNFGIMQYKVLTAASHQTLNNSAVMTAGNGAIVAILQAIPDPAITQAAYCFYDQGTESGSVALQAQDTAHTGNLATGDGLGHLRVRLQSTTAVAVPATDDYQLQYEKNASGTWVNVASPPVIDGFVGGAQNTALSSSMTEVAQSFTGDGQKLGRVRFRLLRGFTPPNGGISAVLYAHTGTFGSSGVPTGPVLATSVTVLPEVSMPQTAVDYDFEFDGQFTLTAGIRYFIGLRTTNTAAGFVNVLGSDPGAHAGNRAAFTTSWAAAATADLTFQVYASPSVGTAVLSYNDPNLTDGAATTNRLTGGSGTFVAGKVSETGLASDVGWSANNYTELLFSCQFVAAQIANNDQFRFRVLRNGATTGMTYSATPLVTLANPNLFWTGSTANIGIAGITGSWSTTTPPGGTTPPTVTVATPTWGQRSEVGATLTSASFSATAGDLLVLAIGHDLGVPSPSPTNSGTAFTWTRRAFRGTTPMLEFWTAPVTASQTMTVTISRGGDTSDRWIARLYKVTGHDPDAPIGATVAPSAPGGEIYNLPITTTADNSVVFVNAYEYQERGLPTSSDLTHTAVRFIGWTEWLSGYEVVPTAGATTSNLDGADGIAGWIPIALEIKAAPAASADYAWQGAAPVASGDTGAFELGTNFLINETVHVSAIRVHGGNTASYGPRRVNVWEPSADWTSAALLTTVDLPDALDGNGPQDVPCDLDFPAGSRRALSYQPGENWYRVTHGLDSAQTTADGAVTIPAVGGRFQVSFNTYPNSSFDNTFYGIDFAYEVVAVGPTPQTWSGSTASIGVAGITGTFTAGARTWTGGSTASVGVAGQTGTWSTSAPGEFTPADLPGLVGWFDAADAASFTLSGANVTQWSDKSGTAHHLTPSGTSPTRITTDLPHPVAHFTAGGLWHVGSNIVTGTALTATCLVRINASIPDQRTISLASSSDSNDYGTTASAIVMSQQGSRFPAAYRAGNKSEATGLNEDTWLIAMSVFDGTNHTMYVDGVAQTPVGSTGTFDIDRISIGQYAFSGADFMQGDVAEIVLTNVALDATQRTDLYDYLTEKWFGAPGPTPQTWVGSTALIGVAGITGFFIGGAVTWTGSTALIGVAGQTGLFVPAPVTWSGSTALVGVAGQTGLFVPAPVTWTGSTAQVGVAGQAGSFSVPLSTLTDTFDATIDKAVKWQDTSAAVVWEAGRAKIPCTSSYPALQTNLNTNQAYDLRASSVFAKITTPPVGSGSRATILNVFAQAADPQNNKYWMATDGNFLTAFTTINGVETNLGATAYNATTHAWWRIRESGGTVFYDRSPDSETWTNFATATTPTWANRVAVGFTSGYYGTETASDAYVDNVNVPTPAQTWSGSTAQVGVAGQTGLFAPGVVAWVGSTAQVGVAGQSGEFFTPALQAWVGSTMEIGIAGQSGAFAAGSLWTGSDAQIGVAGQSGFFTGGPVAWVGSTAQVGVAGQSGAFSTGTAVWTGSTAQIGVAGQPGVFTSNTTWVGSTAEVGVAGQSGLFVSNTTWIGSTAQVGVAGQPGVFTIHWVGSIGQIGVAGQSGTMVGGATTWVGSIGQIGVFVVSGSFASGGTWPGGSTAQIGIAGQSGAFVPGAVTWTGSTAQIGIAGQSGTMVGGATVWAGSIARIGVEGISGAFVAGARVWAGSIAQVGVAGTSGLFTPGANTWVGSVAQIGIAGQSGLFVPGGTVWTGSIAVIGVAGQSGAWFIVLKVFGQWNGQTFEAMQYGDKAVVEWTMTPA